MRNPLGWVLDVHDPLLDELHGFVAQHRPQCTQQFGHGPKVPVEAPARNGCRLHDVIDLCILDALFGEYQQSRLNQMAMHPCAALAIDPGSMVDGSSHA